MAKRFAGLPHVALVVPSLTEEGGVPAVAWFLHRVLRDSGRYTCEFVSLATAFRDPQSVRLFAPRSWIGHAGSHGADWRGEPYRHFGAFLPEFEFQRYRPRRELTDHLNRCDLVQVVAGTPAWAYVGRDVRPPVLLQVATLAAMERRALLERSDGVRGHWRRAMTWCTSRFDERALEVVNTVFVENRWMYGYVQRLIGPERTMLVPPGVDTETFRPVADPRGDYILSVGRLADPRKNVAMLFRAYARLRSLLPDAPKLLLVGATGPSDADRALAEQVGISAHIEVRLNARVEELADIYRHAALFVMSSDEEGLGIVVLEAMASGVPVVSTSCGGPEELVVNGRTGFLTPVGDPEVLATHMSDILLSPTMRARMSASARQRAVSEFSIVVTGRRFVDQYDRILATRSGRTTAS